MDRRPAAGPILPNLARCSGALDLLRELHRNVLIHRRGLAALCLAGAVLLALQVLRPPPPRTVPVWTASHDLAGGAVIAGSDLERVQVPARLAPAYAAADREALVGRTLAVPVEEGEPLSRRKTVGRSMLAGLAGRAAVAIRIADPDLARLLRSGEHVDLYAADPRTGGPAARVATDAVVLAGGRPSEDGGVVVVAVIGSEVAGLVTAASGRYLTAAWNR